VTESDSGCAELCGAGGMPDFWSRLSAGSWDDIRVYFERMEGEVSDRFRSRLRSSSWSFASRKLFEKAWRCRRTADLRSDEIAFALIAFVLMSPPPGRLRGPLGGIPSPSVRRLRLSRWLEPLDEQEQRGSAQCQPRDYRKQSMKDNNVAWFWSW
jgi:hypothetical protein